MQKTLLGILLFTSPVNGDFLLSSSGQTILSENGLSNPRCKKDYQVVIDGDNSCDDAAGYVGAGSYSYNSSGTYDEVFSNICSNITAAQVSINMIVEAENAVCEFEGQVSIEEQP